MADEFFEGGRTFATVEAVNKGASFLSKISVGLFFTQLAIPATNTLFFHNQFVADLSLNTSVPPIIDVAAGTILVANGSTKFVMRRIEKARTRSFNNL